LAALSRGNKGRELLQNASLRSQVLGGQYRAAGLPGDVKGVERNFRRRSKLKRQVGGRGGV